MSGYQKEVVSKKLSYNKKLISISKEALSKGMVSCDLETQKMWSHY